jgi:hypothetical protein
MRRKKPGRAFFRVSGCLAKILGLLAVLETPFLPIAAAHATRVRRGAAELVHHIGGVVDPAGAPLADVKVSVLKGGLEIAAIQTGADGRCTFDDLKAGT